MQTYRIVLDAPTPIDGTGVNPRVLPAGEHRITDAELHAIIDAGCRPRILSVMHSPDDSTTTTSTCRKVIVIRK